ncbi:MAG: hypothetical protein ACC726_01245 [Chloroflexota bacterium]
MEVAGTAGTLTASRKKRVSSAVAGLAAVLALVGTAAITSPVFADEFAVGILVDPSARDSEEPTFMEGFQLAVDQSADVSHPAGEEGGDHLGSMDVVMLVVDDATGPDELLGAAIELAEVEGVPIIVADISSDALAAIAGPVTDAGTMLIVMSDSTGLDLPPTPRLFAAQEHIGVEALLGDRDPGFEDAFLAANGQLPSADAARGYIAGRLVDIGVEATDRDPFDVPTLADALAAVAAIPSASPDPS